MPGWASAIAFFLVPASGVAAVTAGAMIAELDKLLMDATRRVEPASVEEHQPGIKTLTGVMRRQKK